MAAMEGRALAFGPATRCPAGAGHRAQTDWPHLIKRDDRPAVARRTGGQFEHAGGLFLKVRIGTGLPGAGALKGQARVGQQPAQVRRADGDDLGVREVIGQARQRPARQRDPLAVGTGTGDGNNPLALLVGDPAGTPAPILRVQRRQPALVEVMDHAPHVRLVGHPHRRDLRHRVADVRGQQDRRSLARGKVLGLLRAALKQPRLVMCQRPDEHFRGTHHHLLARDASQFAARGGFPVKPCEKAH